MPSLRAFLRILEASVHTRGPVLAPGYRSIDFFGTGDSTVADENLDGFRAMTIHRFIVGTLCVKPILYARIVRRESVRNHVVTRSFPIPDYIARWAFRARIPARIVDG
jgi:hypothetical protein